MSTDLDLATLDHWFGWMRDSAPWRREHEIVYGMWAEIEQLRAYVAEIEGRPVLKTEWEQQQTEIERLRAEIEFLELQAKLLPPLQELAEEQRTEIERLRDKALRFDLDQAGIERREREAVELVESRAEIERLNQQIESRDFLLEERRLKIEQLCAENECLDAEIKRLRREHEKAWADAQLKAAEIERLRALLNNMLTDTQCMHWHEDIRAELEE